jgi:hypothetical protein
LVNDKPDGFGVLENEQGKYIAIFKEGNACNFVIFTAKENVKSNLGIKYFGYISDE